jgi:hypothetical protein
LFNFPYGGSAKRLENTVRFVLALKFFTQVSIESFDVKVALTLPNRKFESLASINSIKLLLNFSENLGIQILYPNNTIGVFLPKYHEIFAFYNLLLI